MHKTNWNKVLKIFVTILTVVIVLFLYALIDCRIPAVRTRESLYRIAQRICDYVQSNREVPKTLKSLSLRNGHHDTIEDGWGNKIEYNIIDDKLVTLMSFGADGKMGGKDENVDFILPFNPNRPEDEYNPPPSEYPIPFTVVTYPNYHTVRAIRLIEEKLERDIDINSQLPQHIEDIDCSQEFMRDGWGHKIIYTVMNDGKEYSLTSLGAGHQKGGEWENADIVFIYQM